MFGAVLCMVFERHVSRVGVREGSESGRNVMYLEFGGGRKVELAGRARSWRIRAAHPYPTPKLGISARHAVSNLSGCGVGAPNPIVNPALSKPTIKNLWAQGPAQNELQHTSLGERPVRFEQVWDAVFSRT